MLNFSYEAINSEGRIVSGIRQAELAHDVEEWLLQSSLSPIDIKIVQAPEQEGSRPISFLERLSGVSLEDRILLCRQISTMLGAGVAILKALSIMSKQTTNPVLKNILAQVAEDIEGGQNLSDSFGRFKEFDILFQNVILIGEETGTLEISFDYLARVFENEKDVNEKIKAATRYPKIVIVSIMGAVLFLMAFVLPKFVDMFSKAGVELPLPTRILMGTSHFVNSYFVLITIGLAGLIFAYKQAMQVEKLVLLRDSFLLRIPILGPLSIKIYMSRFCRVFAVLAKSGVDIIKTLQLGASSLQNQVLVTMLNEVTTEVEKGRDLYQAMSSHPLFPAMVVQMVSIGEESGTLDTMMDKVADYYEVETDYNIKKLSTLIEPILLLFMGLIVSVLALAIYMPMWNMMNVMR